MKVLFINGCLRGEESRTLRLCRRALALIRTAFPCAEITALDLNEESGIMPLRRDTLALRTRLEETGELDHPMFRYAWQFAGTDLLVLGAPYWEFQFPAIVRCYLEQVSVGGITFRYGEDGRPLGLCRARRMLYITTAGGPVADCNGGFEYVKTLCSRMFQIPSIEWAGADCLDVRGTDVEARLRQAEADLQEQISAWGSEPCSSGQKE